VRTGEGVFGPRRAFLLAEAKTPVMSLWSVPDEATRELMESFYRHILNGEPRADALLAARGLPAQPHLPSDATVSSGPHAALRPAPRRAGRFVIYTP
jgi:hypothetical protein